ncbi:hypothetical protein DN451_10020 [Lactobacillus reuteri]|nr:hypothetical protein [Limosilactobacillus reuteri]
MPKSENEMTKSKLLQLRVTPIKKMQFDYKKGSQSQSEALNKALSLYLSDDNNLLQQISEGTTFSIKNQADYMTLKRLYLSSRSLYSDFADFEDKHRQFKINVFKNVFRDFLLPALERPIAEYEDNHQVDDPITD